MTCTQVCLICLIGLPASGKTTLAEKIKTRFRNSYKVETISFDKEISWFEDRSWKEKRKSVLNLVVTSIEKYLNSTNICRVIILDDNMFYRSMRYEYYQIARKYRTGFGEIYLNTPLDVCIKLNLQRSTPLAESSLINMNSNLEAPDPINNKWEVNHIVLSQNLNNTDWLNIEEMINRCFQAPIESTALQVRNVSLESTTSLLHSVDIALRKIVSYCIRNKRGDIDVKSYSLQVSEKRRVILEKIRKGEIILPEVNDGIEDDPVQFYFNILKSEFQ